MITTTGLEELKAIFNRCLLPGNNLAVETRAAGYQLKEKSPWGAVVMERGEDKFIIDISNGGVRSLTYRCEKLNLSVDLVVDGKKVF